MAEPIEMPFWKRLAWAQGTMYYMGVKIPCSVCVAAAFAAKGIIQHVRQAQIVL